MPYVEVWVDPDEYDPQQVRAVRDLVLIAESICPTLLPPQQEEVIEAIAKVRRECLLDESNIEPYPIDIKYKKWLSERGGA
jgi:hypothetical protein